MTEQRMAQVSLSAFREKIATYGQPVEVSRRDGAGGIQVLGLWTPYMTWEPDAARLPETYPSSGLDIPIDDIPSPVVISSPADVAAVVRPDPVRSVPKPSQQKRGKRP